LDTQVVVEEVEEEEKDEEELLEELGDKEDVSVSAFRHCRAVRAWNFGL
jgi:transcription initiation factor TFIID subunit TAF12